MPHPDSPISVELFQKEHPDYHVNLQEWRYIEDIYIGRNIANKLVKRTQRETKEEYEERQNIFTFQNYFAHTIDSNAGRIMEEEPEIDWGHLGDVEDPSSLAFRLYHNIDGTGMNFNTYLRRSINELILKGEVGGLVDGMNDNQGIHAEVLDPMNIVYHSPDKTHFRVKREAFPNEYTTYEDLERLDFYTVFTPEGREHYSYNKDDDMVIRYEPDNDQEGYIPYSTPYENRFGKPTPPVWRVELPIPRNIQYQQAQAQMKITEMESVRDMGMRKTGFGYLVIPAGEDERDDIRQGIVNNKDAVIFIPKDSSRGVDFEQPDFTSATQMEKIIKEKKIAFYKNAFRDYERAGKLYQSATSRAADTQESVSSYLSLVALALEEHIQRLLFFIEKTYYPEREPLSQVTFQRKYGVPKIEVEQFGSTGNQRDSE